MKKKIIYILAICIIIIGAVIIGTMGLKADITYSRNIRIDVYLGKSFENEDIRQIAKEIFGNDKILVQKIEYYGDMASITVNHDNKEDLKEKLEQFNNKINEKYEIKNKVEDLNITYQPKEKLTDVLKPYVLPLAISLIVVLVYVMVRYRKIGILKTIAAYVVSVLASEAVLLSFLAIARVPINRLIVPIGLLVYIITITIITAIQESKYYHYKENIK